MHNFLFNYTCILFFCIRRRQLLVFNSLAVLLTMYVLIDFTLLTLVRALIVSKVDYCNSVLAGMSRHLHDRLQSVLNAAARLVFSARRNDHIKVIENGAIR